ncbi:MAG: protein-glutamate O-methyltransferase [Alphaproteobacteria bacterium]|nr:protein-glutamate O-methyltransferase [Alphaproteobacteria bacterium]
MQAAKQTEFTLSDSDFNKISAFVRTRTGIVLSERKRDLVYSRLVRRLRALRLDSFAAYCDYLEGPDGDQEHGSLINAITTNLTGFFREAHHFEHLAENVLKPLVRERANGQRRIRIWSSAASTGEEPYSIAMVLRSVVPETGGWDAKILATDIDTDVIAHGKAGRYGADAVERMPEPYRSRYVGPEQGGRVQIDQRVRNLITFKQLNLMDDWPMRGPFDVIFCRNVVIYFDKQEKCVLFDRMAELLQPNGWLYIGHSENLLGITDRFQLQGRTIYRRVS